PLLPSLQVGTALYRLTRNRVSSRRSRSLSSGRARRGPGGDLLRMRNFVNSINHFPHAEERPRARLEARTMLTQAALIAAALIGGYPFGAAAAERTPLYYQDPSGKPDYSPIPKKDADGRDYVPIYDEPGAAPVSTPASPAPAAAPGGERKILYYRNPMGLPDTSPVPKKDSMGMDYIAVYADEGSGTVPGTVKISPERIQM